MKFGAVTIGQSPRNDMIADMLPLLGNKAEVVQRGALDDLSPEEIQACSPQLGDGVLITRLRSGRTVTVAEKHMVRLVQEAVTKLEREGVELILLLCTGTFPPLCTQRAVLIRPCDILHQVVPLLSQNSEIVVLVPSPDQVEESTTLWKKYVRQCTVLSASPYEGTEGLVQAARQAQTLPGDTVVLDCMGFSQTAKDVVARESGKRVILSRTLVARVLSELI